MHVKRHPWSSDLHTKGKDLPDPGLRVATFANRWRYTEEGEVRDERPEPSAVAAMAMLPQKTQSPGQATVARHQRAEHRLVDVAGSSRETHLASQCSHAATAAQSAKVHPANGTRTGSAQPRPPERPPPAHDRIPTGRRCPAAILADVTRGYGDHPPLTIAASVERRRRSAGGGAAAGRPGPQGGGQGQPGSAGRCWPGGNRSGDPRAPAR